MKNHFFLKAFMGISLVTAGVVVWGLTAQAEDFESRNDVINKELNCVAHTLYQNEDPTWTDVCYTMDPVPRGAGREDLVKDEMRSISRKRERDDNFMESSTGLHNPSPRVKKPVSGIKTRSFEETHQSPHSYELATELYSYKYTENIGVKTSGVKGGMTGAYQYRMYQNETIYSWDDIIHETSRLNIFRLEGRFSYGKVKYEGSGSWSGIPELNFETRGLIGIEFPFENVMITPFGGIGYRYLFNDFSKMPAGLVGGQQYLSGYDRESFYIYFPLGVDAAVQIDKRWSVGFKGEFDIFVWGKQISHLENSVDLNDVNAGIDKLENTQKHGFGLRFSTRLIRETEKFDLFFEPFLRYWHIEDSEVSFVTYSGSLNCSGNLCQAGLEPDNKTWEYGINLGAKF